MGTNHSDAGLLVVAVLAVLAVVLGVREPTPPPLSILWVHSERASGRHAEIGPGWTNHWAYDTRGECLAEAARPGHPDGRCLPAGGPPPGPVAGFDAGPTPTPDERYPLFRRLCATQRMVDRVAAMISLPTGPPPGVVVVDEDPSGLGRAGWYLPALAHDGRVLRPAAVHMVRPWIHVCPHEVAHHLQMLSGELRRNTFRAEKQAQWVQRRYWRQHPPWDE